VSQAQHVTVSASITLFHIQFRTSCTIPIGQEVPQLYHHFLNSFPLFPINTLYFRSDNTPLQFLFTCDPTEAGDSHFFQLGGWSRWGFPSTNPSCPGATTAITSDKPTVQRQIKAGSIISDSHSGTVIHPAALSAEIQQPYPKGVGLARAIATNCDRSSDISFYSSDTDNLAKHHQVVRLCHRLACSDSIPCASSTRNHLQRVRQEKALSVHQGCHTPRQIAAHRRIQKFKRRRHDTLRHPLRTISEH